MVIYMNEIDKKIINVIEKIKPYLSYENGGVEFVKFEDGVCYVKLTGACAGCMYSDITLKNSIEEVIVSEIPEVISVENIEE